MSEFEAGVDLVPEGLAPVVDGLPALAPVLMWVGGGVRWGGVKARTIKGR